MQSSSWNEGTLSHGWCMDISDVFEPSLLKQAFFLAGSLFYSAWRFIFFLTKIGHIIGILGKVDNDSLFYLSFYQKIWTKIILNNCQFCCVEKSVKISMKLGISQGSKVLMHGRNIYFGYVLDNSSKYSVSQKVFSKLTIISPRKTQDNSKINIQKFTQIRKSWAPLFSNQKGILILHND